MYFDNKPCQVCGSEVELRPHEESEPRDRVEPDATVDDRVCTNPDCPTNQGTTGTDTPEP